MDLLEADGRFLGQGRRTRGLTAGTAVAFTNSICGCGAMDGPGGQARKVSVAKAMEARVKRLREARGRAGETVKRRRTASASRAAGREAAARD